MPDYHLFAAPAHFTYQSRRGVMILQILNSITFLILRSWFDLILFFPYIFFKPMVSIPFLDYTFMQYNI